MIKVAEKWSKSGRKVVERNNITIFKALQFYDR